MSAWQIASLAPIAPMDMVEGTAPAQNEVLANQFAQLIGQAVEGVGRDMQVAEQAMSDMAAGKPQELHEVMISLERARLSVQTFVQARNNLIEAYQDLMRMQL